MPAPKHVKPKQFEAKEQMAVVKWADLAPHPFLPGKIGDYLFAIPNGGYGLSAGLANKMRSMGLRAGVSDLFLAVPVQPYGGLFIEMKRQRAQFGRAWEIKAAMKANQIEWIERMTLAGYSATFAFGAQEAMDIIEDYLSNGR